MMKKQQLNKICKRGIRLFNLKKYIKHALLIFIGTIIYSVSISLFLDPNNLAPGGLTGIVILIAHYLPVKVGTLVFILNIPIMAIAIWKFGIRFLTSTVFSVVLSSLFINILDPYGPITRQPLLAAAAGGSLLAIGLGLTFKAGATTGGMDIIIKLIKLKYKYIKTGRLFLIIDSIIVTASAFIFQNIDIALYAGVAVFINSLVFDSILYGADGAKLTYIISDKQEIISKRLIENLEVGVTYIQGKGAYSEKDKKVLMCAMKKQLLPEAQEIVKEVDKNAFMIVTSATEIYGEGFKHYILSRLRAYGQPPNSIALKIALIHSRFHKPHKQRMWSIRS